MIDIAYRDNPATVYIITNVTKTGYDGICILDEDGSYINLMNSIPKGSGYATEWFKKLTARVDSFLLKNLL